jgi:hypothetical protein
MNQIVGRMSGVERSHYDWWRSLPTMRITMREALELGEYSATNPTGVTPGKRWRRHNGAFDQSFKRQGGVPRWIIRTYEAIPGDDKHVSNGQYRAVIRVKVPFVFGPCEQCTEPTHCTSWKNCGRGL